MIAPISFFDWEWSSRGYACGIVGSPPALIRRFGTRPTKLP